MRNLVPLLIFLWVVISFVASAIRAAKAKQEAPDANETEEQKRMREIQERIRRKIAERRGGGAPTVAPPLVKSDEPRPRPTMMAPAPVHEDPLGDMLRRLAGEQAPKPAPPSPIVPAAEEAAILQRQQQLAEQIRALEVARQTAARHTAQMATEQSGGGAEATARATVRAGWLTDLRDAKSLRRAIVLREILSAPVALR
jgi:hypothetical protein